MMALDYGFPWVNCHQSPTVPLLVTRVRKYNLAVDLFSVLNCRISEGFALQKIEVNADLGKFHRIMLTQTVEVHLLLFWQQNILIGYTIECSTNPYKLTIEIKILGYYEFLQQFATLQKQVGKK